MSRQYENPYVLKDRIEGLKEQMENEQDEDRLIGLHEEIAELEERLNFAWQDIEAELYDEE